MGGQAGGHSIRVKRHWKRMYDGRTSVARAWSRVGEDGYSVWGNNCEHFVEWCITGQHASPQAEALAHTAPVPASVTITWAGIGVVSVGGPIAGLSASGTMSGLATVGGLVGGGAVAGVVVLSAAPAIAVTAVVSLTVLRDHKDVPTREREARRIGRRASALAVATAALGGNVALISAAGVVPGLSAAGITSGLAAIGTTSGMAAALGSLAVPGGAMLAGVALTVAAPALAATVVGYGAYRTARWLKSRTREPLLLSAPGKSRPHGQSDPSHKA